MKISPEYVLINGATGKLGKILTKNILKHYKTIQNIIIIGRNKEILKGIKNNNPKILTIREDLSNIINRNKVRQKVLDLLGNNKLDLVLFPIGVHKTTKMGSLENIHEIININLLSPMEDAVFYSNYMEKGDIVFFGDSQIKKPQTGYSAYYAAKSALLSLTHTLALELAPNIKVNCISPGIMNLKPTAKNDALKRWSDKIPLKSLGDPLYICNALFYIIENSYLTGVNLPVDGGFSLSFTKN
jgi:pteridine reductase